MLERKNYLSFFNLILLILLLGYLIINHFKSDNKIVVIDSNKLFNGFNMTKELKRTGEKELQKRKLFLDSLYSKLQSPALSSQEKQIMMQQMIKAKEDLEQFNQTFAAEQTSKIWSRIHGYANEFSKIKKYQLIIGSENSSTILFVDEKLDATNELLNYINGKYEGIK